jgi:cephalosporin hydroxylase
VRALVEPGESALLLLDSDHRKAHVLAELDAYTPLVGVGSYAIVQDGFVMQLVSEHHGPRSEPDWSIDNPLEAVRAFAAAHDDFVLEPPPRDFDEGVAGPGVTHWTGGWLRRVSA